MEPAMQTVRTVGINQVKLPAYSLESVLPVDLFAIFVHARGQVFIVFPSGPMLLLLLVVVVVVVGGGGGGYSMLFLLLFL